MPTLHWIGKEKVVNHHQDVPFRVLDHKYGFRVNDDNNKTETLSGNKIIHGDNLEALKSLLPEYEGKIKCIYIDPPYNTGEEKWKYNDNVNDPKIKKWLGEVVGKQGEDFSRHDKWLCMIYPRLKLLHKLLTEDGVIFISIDDNEYHNLRIICDEIFGVTNILANLIWDLGTGTTAGHFTRGHEYILCYSKNKLSISNFKNPNEGEMIVHGALKKISRKNPAVEITFPAGFEYSGVDAVFTGELGSSEKEYILSEKMEFENGKLKYPVTIRAGFAMRKQVEDFIAAKEVYDTKGQKLVKFYFNKNGILFYEKEKTITNPRTVLSNIANTKTGSSELTKIFSSNPFDFPKSSNLLSYLINLTTDNNSIILDSFAGSGTTAHAVMNLNKKDGGNRKFILIELGDYAEDITAERVRRVMKGYSDIDGTGGEFDFYELGEPIFKKDKNLNEAIGEGKIREYIYYTETKQHLERERTEKSKYILDTYNRTGYYFYYEKDSLTTLSIDTLNIVTERAEQYIIYADKCTIDKDDLAAKNIVFKKIPRDIKRF